MKIQLVTNEKIAETSSKGNQEKWFDSTLNKWYKVDQFGYEALSESVVSKILEMPSKVTNYIDSLEIHNAISEVWNVIRLSNKYIDETAPWTLKGEENKERLGDVLHNLYFAIYSVATMLQSFIPTTAKKIEDALGVKLGNFSNISEKQNQNLEGNAVVKVAIFPRLDIEKEIKYITVDSVENNKQKTTLNLTIIFA